VKRSLIAIACLMLACAGIAASGAEYPPADYRPSELCMVDFVTGGPRQDPPRLIVHAIDPFGAVLPGAGVVVQEAGRKLADAATDAAGHAVLDGLPVGKGRLRVEMAGFRSVEVTVRLRKGCVTAVIVPMEVGLLANTDPVPTR
jgi:hypothetical protein